MEYKYQEIMERIEVTPEMRERILRKLQNVHASRTGPRTIQRWIPLAAAACLILVVGIFQLRSGLRPAQSEHAETGSVETTVPGETVCRDLEELSSLAGFPVPDVADAIPFSVKETSYSLLWGELAQAGYSGTNGEEITLRISDGEEDNSGVYDTFPIINDWTVGNTTVTVKGENGQYTLAVWTMDNRAYSVYAYPAQPEKVWRELIPLAVPDN